MSAKLYQVQVVDGARYVTLSDSNRISVRLVAPPRGRVLDRFGAVVAGNRLNWRALLTAEETGSVDATLDAFAQVVPLADHERARIERELRRRHRFIPVTVREFLSWEDMARIEVNAPDLPGIYVDVGTTRLYPQGPALAHVVGYVAPRTRRMSPPTPCCRCRGSASGARAWNGRTTRGCAAMPARCRWR